MKNRMNPLLVKGVAFEGYTPWLNDNNVIYVITKGVDESVEMMRYKDLVEASDWFVTPYGKLTIPVDVWNDMREANPYYNPLEGDNYAHYFKAKNLLDVA